MFKIKNPRFVKSILHPKEKPAPPLPEFAFVGRSNVGKSSMINILVNVRQFARVSKKPGKTRTINFFKISDRIYFVDLPGYGFAHTSKAERLQWQKAIEPYLKHNPQLRLLFLLIDGKVGPKETDKQLVDWLRYHHIPFLIVATKIDQVPRGKRPQQEKKIREFLGLGEGESIVFFSARDRTGRKEILHIIEKLL